VLMWYILNSNKCTLGGTFLGAGDTKNGVAVDSWALQVIKFIQKRNFRTIDEFYGLFRDFRCLPYNFNNCFSFIKINLNSSD